MRTSLEISALAKHLFTLAQRFNAWYHQYRVLDEKRDGVKHLRILLTHLFVVYYGVLSAITPPVAIAAFAAALQDAGNVALLEYLEKDQRGTLAQADRLSSIGTLAAGQEADLTILDLSSTPAIAQRTGEAENIWEALFPTIMMGDDRAIADVWIAGKKYTAQG